MADAFVRKQFAKAMDLKAEGKFSEALFEFGVGLHTLQDATSPEHTGFQEWSDDMSNTDKIKHGLGEISDPGEGSNLYKITNKALGWFESGKLPEGNLFDNIDADK